MERPRVPFLHLFVLFGSSVEWTRPTFTGEGHLYSVYGSSVHPFQRHSPRHTGTNVVPAMWAALSPVKLTQKFTITVAKDQVVPMTATHCWLFLTPWMSGLQWSPVAYSPPATLGSAPPLPLLFHHPLRLHTFWSSTNWLEVLLEPELSQPCPLHVLFLAECPPCPLLPDSGSSFKTQLRGC